MYKYIYIYIYEYIIYIITKVLITEFHQYNIKYTFKLTDIAIIRVFILIVNLTN